MPVEQIKVVNTVSRVALEEVGYATQMLVDYPNLASIVNEFLIAHDEQPLDFELLEEFTEDVEPQVDRIVVEDEEI